MTLAMGKGGKYRLELRTPSATPYPLGPVEVHLELELKKELDRVQQSSQKLYGAVEKGLLPMDSTLTDRANKLQAQRQGLLTEIAGLRRLKQMPLRFLERRRFTPSRQPCANDCLKRMASSARST